MTISIAGATGLTGSLCLQRMLATPEIDTIFAIGRRETGVQHPKLREVQLINNQLTETVVADAFVCCLGTTIAKAGSQKAFEEVDYELPLYLAKMLQREGCQTAAVVSAMGANATSAIFYNRTKGKMETGMRNIGFTSLALLRPSIISGPRKEARIGEKIGVGIMKITGPLLMGRWKNFRAIKASNIAAALVKAIIKPKPGTTVYLSERVKKLAKT
jgi:uncharacterized protein YbjT (DUF2867 family)